MTAYCTGNNVDYRGNGILSGKILLKSSAKLRSKISLTFS